MMLLVLIFIAKKSHDKALKKEAYSIFHVVGLPVTKNVYFYIWSTTLGVLDDAVIKNIWLLFSRV